MEAQRTGEGVMNRQSPTAPPGGFLILTEFSANDQRIKDRAKNFFETENYYDHYFTEEEIKNLFSKNFEIISKNETMPTQPPPHLMINALMKRKV